MKFVVFASTLAVMAVSAVLLSESEAVSPQPGALSVSLNTTSINNIMQTFVPILSYYMLNNKTINTDIHESNILYKFDLDSVHIVEVTGYTTKLFEQIPGTSKVHVQLGGINTTVDVNGSLKALHFIPLDASQV